MKGHVYTIYKIAMANGLIYYLSQHSGVSLEQCIENAEVTLKSGDGVEHPQKRLTDLLKLTGDLGLTINDNNNLELTPLGSRYAKNFSKNVWEVTITQAKILRDYIFINPTRNRTVFAITAMARVLKPNSSLIQVKDTFAKIIEKSDDWGDVTKPEKSKFVLNYLIELRMVTIHGSEYIITDIGRKTISELNKNFDVISMQNLGEEQVERIVFEQSDSEFKNILDNLDTTASIEVKEGLIKIRKYSKKVIDELKSKYNNHCQICGYSSEQEYGFSIVEAHHLELFSLNQNNKPENIIILCPNHHRLVHAGKASFDKVKKEFVFESGQHQILQLNHHI